MKRIKRDYTDAERKTILNFIIENEGFYRLRGNSLWKTMERKNILDRTWQSMKEHFRMKIVKNIRFYGISKENSKKILAGYMNTSNVGRTSLNNRRFKRIKYSLDFSDEDKNLDDSISSDESANLVVEVDVHIPKKSKMGFNKQTIKKTSKIKSVSNTEESTTNKETLLATNEPDEELININEIVSANDTKQTDTNEISVTSSIPDVISDDLPSINVSLTNVNEAFVEFSIADDKKFLQAITKYESNLLNCACIVTFIKQYVDHCDICVKWTDLYDRFLEILNNLQLYDFLAPEIVTKLRNLKEPLEKYRSAGFQEPKIEVFPVELENKTFKFALAPDPEVIYLEKESLDVVVLLENIRISLYEIFEKTATGELSENKSLEVINELTKLNKKYVPQTSIDNNYNGDSFENVQNVEEELHNDPEIQIKEENLSSSIDKCKTVTNNAIVKPENVSIEMPEEENESNLSDTISLQPEMTLNLSEIQSDSSEFSQYLESLTTNELNVTNLIGQLIENDGDLEVFTCENNL